MRGFWGLIRDLIEATIVIIVIAAIVGIFVFSLAWAAAGCIRWLYTI